MPSKPISDGTPTPTSRHDHNDLQLPYHTSGDLWRKGRPTAAARRGRQLLASASARRAPTAVVTEWPFCRGQHIAHLAATARRDRAVPGCQNYGLRGQSDTHDPMGRDTGRPDLPMSGCPVTGFGRKSGPYRPHPGTRSRPIESSVPAPNQTTPQNCKLYNFISGCLGLHVCRAQPQPCFVVVGDDMVQLSQ